MFVAIYRWRILPGREAEFATAWHEGTLLFREEQGALGSRLHKCGDGNYFAYAQWPSPSAYHAQKDLSGRHRAVLTSMAACIEESLPGFTGEVQDDLLLHP